MRDRYPPLPRRCYWWDRYLRINRRRLIERPWLWRARRRVRITPRARWLHIRQRLHLGAAWRELRAARLMEAYNRAIRTQRGL